MEYFIYKTTNQINGKYYIGKHKTKRRSDGYLGSGRAIKQAIQKYGRAAFHREILEYAESDDQLNLLEQQYVTEQIVADKNSYNMVTGGRGGWNYVHENGFCDPKEYGKRGREEFRRRMQSPAYYNAFCERKKTKLLEFYAKGGKNPNLGRKLTDEVKRNISEARKMKPSAGTTGFKWVNRDGKNKLTHPDQLLNYLSDGYSLGRVTSRSVETG